MSDKLSNAELLDQLSAMAQSADEQGLDVIVSLMGAIQGNGVLNSKSIFLVSSLVFKSKWLVDYHTKYAEVLAELWQPELLQLRAGLQENNPKQAWDAASRLFELYFFKAINDIVYLHKLNEVQTYSLIGSTAWVFDNAAESFSEKDVLQRVKLGSHSTLTVTFTHSELTHMAMGLEDDLFNYLYAEPACKEPMAKAFVAHADQLYASHLTRLTHKVQISGCSEDRTLRVSNRCRFLVVATDTNTFKKMVDSFSSRDAFVHYCDEQLHQKGSSVVLTVKDNVVAYVVPVVSPSVMTTPVEFTSKVDAG